MSKTVMFVDDEKQILKAFRRLFIETEFNIVIANSGIEALQLLEEKQIDLIITGILTLIFSASFHHKKSSFIVMLS
jgi:CheY-like chemotaxis protein